MYTGCHLGYAVNIVDQEGKACTLSINVCTHETESDVLVRAVVKCKNTDEVVDICFRRLSRGHSSVTKLQAVDLHHAV